MYLTQIYFTAVMNNNNNNSKGCYLKLFQGMRIIIIKQCRTTKQNERSIKLITHKTINKVRVMEADLT